MTGTVEAMTPKGLSPAWKSPELSKMRQTPNRRQIVLLTQGWPGHGQSTFGLSIPKCCYIASEAGGVEMAEFYGIKDGDPAFPWRVRSKADMDSIVKVLKDEASSSSRTYDTVCIDTLDSLGGNALSMLAGYVKETWPKEADFVGGIGQGTGWSRLAEITTGYLSEIIEAGYNLVMLCHITKKFADNKTEVTRDLTKRVDDWVRKHCNYFGMVCKLQDTKPVMRTVNGREVEIGREQISRHILKFSSLDPAEAAVLKARIFKGDTVELSKGEGWERFMAGRNAALQEAGLA